MRSLVVLALLGSTAWAQSPPAPPSSVPAEAPLVGPPPGAYLTPPQMIDLGPGDDGYKSPTTALVLPLALTIGGASMMFVSTQYARGESKGLGQVGGFLLTALGPSTGHWYAGKTWNRGLKWRLITFSTIAVTSVPLVLSFGGHTEGDKRFGEVVGAIFLLEAAAYLGATAYEIGTSPRAARHHNHQHGRASIAVAPVIGREPGIAIIGAF